MTDIHETKAQAAIRMGRDLSTLEPQTRLAWAHAADIRDPAPEAPAVPDGLTPAAAKFLNGRSVDELDGTDKIIFDHWMDPRFGDLPADEQPAKKDVFAVDPALMKGLDPTLRLQIGEAFNTVIAARKERAEGKHPNTYRHRDYEVEKAMTHLRPYLAKPAA